MVWERNSFIDMEKTSGKRLIVGHSATPIEIIKESLSSNRILFGGGCVYEGLERGLGYLCALELNTFKLYYQKNIEYRK